MANISTLGASGIGDGVLFPNLTHQFQVRFVEYNTKNELDISKDLVRQLVSISRVSQPRVTHSKDSRTFSMVFEDDRSNVACKALQALLKIDAFNIEVDNLNGAGEVTRTTIYSFSKLASIELPEFNYAAATNAPTAHARLVPPRLDSQTLEALKEQNFILFALYDILSNSSVVINYPTNEDVTGASKFFAEFEFSQIFTRFPE